MLSKEELSNMWYVDFMANINETNRCPWWKDAICQLAINTFLNSSSKVLDVWCNTGFVSFEIARLIKCHVTWLDINSNMIMQSNTNNNDPDIRDLVDFVVWNGEALPFADNSYDLVTSGWSTVFMDNIENWLREYKRVCKNWWYIADINFYYSDEVPYDTIAKINKLLGIEIQAWWLDYFLNLYDKVGLEKHYIYTNDTYKPDKNRLESYCKELISWSLYDNSELAETAYNKLYSYMKLFYENNKYLRYGLFIYRKRPEAFKEQFSLFWN